MNRHFTRLLLSRCLEARRQGDIDRLLRVQKQLVNLRRIHTSTEEDDR